MDNDFLLEKKMELQLDLAVKKLLTEIQSIKKDIEGFKEDFTAFRKDLKRPSNESIPSSPYARQDFQVSPPIQNPPLMNQSPQQGFGNQGIPQQGFQQGYPQNGQAQNYPPQGYGQQFQNFSQQNQYPQQQTIQQPQYPQSQPNPPVDKPIDRNGVPPSAVSIEKMFYCGGKR
ncbi:MAG: hypothetical protein V1743_04450 [Nanoarchaeota archaeon]